MKPDEPINLLAIHTAGARMNPQKSTALPQSEYGDPSKRIRFRAEIEQEERRKARPERFKR